MREKLIELLNDCQAKGFWSYGTDCKTGEHGGHEMTAEDIADYLMENITSKWIPVTERLPESKVKILVYGGSIEIWHNGVKQPMPSIFTGYMRGLDEGWFAWESDDYISNVTHWMPLPEPPKGE